MNALEQLNEYMPAESAAQQPAPADPTASNSGPIDSGGPTPEQFAQQLQTLPTEQQQFVKGFMTPQILQLSSLLWGEGMVQAMAPFIDQGSVSITIPAEAHAQFVQMMQQEQPQSQATPTQAEVAPQTSPGGTPVQQPSPMQ